MSRAWATSPTAACRPDPGPRGGDAPHGGVVVGQRGEEFGVVGVDAALGLGALDGLAVGGGGPRFFTRHQFVGVGEVPPHLVVVGEFEGAAVGVGGVGVLARVPGQGAEVGEGVVAGPERRRVLPGLAGGGRLAKVIINRAQGVVTAGIVRGEGVDPAQRLDGVVVAAMPVVEQPEVIVLRPVAWLAAYGLAVRRLGRGDLPGPLVRLPERVVGIRGAT
jgi:hypothetical protein